MINILHKYDHPDYILLKNACSIYQDNNTLIYPKLRCFQSRTSSHHKNNINKKEV